MTIRSRLLMGYFVVLLTIFTAGYFSIYSILAWSAAGEKLSRMNQKLLLAERLRNNITRQTNHAVDYLDGHVDSREKFLQIQSIAEQLLVELKSDTLSPDEVAHLMGLEETQFELVWLMNRFFQSSLSLQDKEDSKHKLREIADEVSDEIATLFQYYRSRENESLSAADKAGVIATYVIWGAVISSIIQLLVLVYLLQRWLAKPITKITEKTMRISEGDFDTRAEIKTNDEWGQLATAINDMAVTLKSSQQKILAQERLAALGEIASYTAHNLRNPLAGIRAAAQLAITEYQSDHKATAEAFNDIIVAVDRMDLWIKRFLAYAKPLSIHPELTEINSLIEQALTITSKPFPNKAISVEMNLQAGLPSLEIDAILIEQVLTVIINNAFEAIHEKGTIRINTGLNKDPNRGNSIRIDIEDNGRGIPKQVKEKMFRPFVTTKEGGTGLGLAQAKKIIDLHGGEIAIIDLRNGGTGVIIHLPLPPNSSQ